MAAFSPSIMADIGTISGVFNGRQQNYFHIKGSLTSIMSLTREAFADHSNAAQAFKSYARGEANSSWGGFIKGKLPEFFDTGISTDAHQAFDNALASIDTKKAPASPEFAIAGGVWSVPRHLTGHPLSAIKRPKTALPPKDWHISAFFSASVEASDVATPLAKLARAAWRYQMEGGQVSLTIHYAVAFYRPFQGNEGLLVSVKVPLTNIAAIATACSVTFWRGVVLSWMRGLSGADQDGGPRSVYTRPGIASISGNIRSDKASLATLGIL